MNQKASEEKKTAKRRRAKSQNSKEKKSVSSDKTAIAITQLKELKEQMSNAFIDRDEVIESLVLALLSGEHVVILGPPGTGKSDLVRAFCSAIGGNHFQALLTRFSKPDEVVGPVDIQELSNGKYVINGDGYLPKADTVFLDEVFKANSSILNSLLTALNERMFAFNPAQGMKPIPLKMCVGASNELPEDDTLALWDRFTFRHWIGYLESSIDVLDLVKMQGDPKKKISVVLDLESLNVAQAEVQNVNLSKSVAKVIQKIVMKLGENGLRPSDRTVRKIVKVAKAKALLRGSSEVSPSDLHVICNMVWNKPKEKAKIKEVVNEVAFPVQGEIERLLDTLMIEYKSILDASTAGKMNLANSIQSIQDFNQLLVEVSSGVVSLGEKFPGNDELIKNANSFIDDITNKMDSLLHGLIAPKRRKKKDEENPLAGLF